MRKGLVNILIGAAVLSLNASCVHVLYNGPIKSKDISDAETQENIKYESYGFGELRRMNLTVLGKEYKVCEMNGIRYISLIDSNNVVEIKSNTAEYRSVNRKYLEIQKTIEPNFAK